jgi:hypothetical protein
MARPLDWGDPKPSDLDDSAPINPTAGFEEIDYEVGAVNRGSGVRPKNPRKDTPDLQQAFVKSVKRTNFAGLITEVDSTKRFYSVLRQDGFLGPAETMSDDRYYQAHEVGDVVSVSQSEAPDTYYFSGQSKPLEYSSISAYSTQPYGPFNTEMELFFGETTEVTGIDLELGGGYIRVLRDLYGLYEIHYSAIFQCTDPDQSHTDSAIEVVNECPEQSNSLGILSNRINFDRGVGLLVAQDGECATDVTIKVGETDYAPYSPAGGGIIKWSNEPRIASAIKVGTMVGQGWVKIECNGAGKLWLGHGSQELKLLFPSNAPSLASHLYASGIYGTAVKLKWTETPGCGTMTEYGGKAWVVKNGLVISGPGIEPCTENEQFLPAEPERKDWECSF